MKLKLLAPLALCSLVAIGITACKGKQGRSASRTIKANVQAFDPDADVSFDFSNHDDQGEAPDDYALRTAFSSSFDAMTACVDAYKSRKRIAETKVLDGAIAVSVKLNPQEPRPLGINASVTGQHHDDTMTTCIKEAVDQAPFPTYKGAPMIVDFETELDAGWEPEEE